MHYTKTENAEYNFCNCKHWIDPQTMNYSYDSFPKKNDFMVEYSCIFKRMKKTEDRLTEGSN